MEEEKIMVQRQRRQRAAMKVRSTSSIIQQHKPSDLLILLLLVLLSSQRQQQRQCFTFAAAQQTSETELIVCNICFDGYTVTKPEDDFFDPHYKTKASCAELQTRGLAADYTYDECQTIQSRVFFGCGCEPVTGGSSSSIHNTAPANNPTLEVGEEDNMDEYLSGRGSGSSSSSKSDSQPSDSYSDSSSNSDTMKDTSSGTGTSATEDNYAPPPPPVVIHNYAPPAVAVGSSSSITISNNPICHICFKGYSPKNPGGFTRDPITRKKNVCADLEEKGLAGYYSSEQCQKVQVRAFYPCDCQRQPISMQSTTQTKYLAAVAENQSQGEEQAATAPESATTTGILSEEEYAVPLQVTATTTPTTTTTTTTSVCYICFIGFVPTLMDNQSRDPVTKQLTTCSDLEARGLAAEYTRQQCRDIQTKAFFSCGCTEISPNTNDGGGSGGEVTTEAPTTNDGGGGSVATDAPTTTTDGGQPAAATDPPTTMSTTTDDTTPINNPDETVISTLAPTDESNNNNDNNDNNPTMQDVEGNVTILLYDVPSPMSPSFIESYQMSATIFFANRLDSVIPPVRSVTSFVLDQFMPPVSSPGTSGGGGTRQLRTTNYKRQLRRYLQSASVQPLQTLIQVIGRRSLDADSDISRLLEDAVNNHMVDFVAAVRNATPPINQLYFQDIDTATALPYVASDYPNLIETTTGGGTDTATTIVPTNATVESAPPPPPPKKLGGGAIAGIVIGSLCIVITCCATCFRFGQGIDDEDLYDDGEKELEEASSDGDEEDENEEEEEEQSGDDEDGGAAEEQTPLAATPAPSAVPTPVAAVSAVASTPAPPSEPKVAVSALAPPPAPRAPSPVAPPPPSAPIQQPPVSAPVSAAAAAGSTYTAPPQQAPPQAPPTPATQIVVAPPGKLGIVIDTTPDGPLVFKINPGSPLEGKLFPGDQIVAIDGIETKAMSAMEITSLMVKTATQTRKMLVIPGDGRVS